MKEAQNWLNVKKGGAAREALFNITVKPTIKTKLCVDAVYSLSTGLIPLDWIIKVPTVTISV